MARKISMKQAINEALDQEMTRDPSVIVLGEDIVGGAGGQGEMDAWGGVLGVTKGLYAKHGDRLMDTPLSESAYVGAAVGAAACGMRPVAELMFIDFMGVCFDQIFNQAAKFRYMFGGKAETPVVIRAMVGAGFRAAAQHSQMLTPLFTHIPGLKVVCPSTPYDTKGMLIQAIRDNDPVIFCEHKNLYGFEGEVPEASYAIPFGEANVVREGKHATIVTYGLMVHRSLDAAATLAKEGVEVEIVDLRSLSPIDMDTVLDSVTKTGRLICVDEASPRCNIGTDVSAQVAMQAFGALKAQIELVSPPHVPVPFSPTLEDLYIPSAAQVADAVRRTMKGKH
ncbi:MULTISPECIES: alpha-ketoacid dehydrogenase subunit beta [Methylibium]|uniref:Acetoin dehydrogenase complex, E1 component, beta subunit n=1 Tax=Methylibium petroleiphilum (strain ATCC BAA-1232 / LMG 22953 / PM1) TaxID=420662 RepID=A2SG74_METPP|nr:MULTISPECIES: alpha-ketoacid dehydrogenase subunit beta [Methylibium]ABM94563.1 acetoin dehydrogenase complex, E1 component, beta subunit [Methylibium petroleiphilum PM1]EWS53623.1 Acetoin:2,6-dichlorophenolindophenol oxidoreductase subunit beta [Methylibium sp. T29]EWS58022.1 Acetoin:2,6-dichlorophenolindophenol oxidoreductase subunit beta [Methylibium sp. T29-B]